MTKKQLLELAQGSYRVKGEREQYSLIKTKSFISLSHAYTLFKRIELKPDEETIDAKSIKCHVSFGEVFIVGEINVQKLKITKKHNQ